ncbi:NUDIX domain-containing protein [Streptomyces zagrosensis]|uniref:8-oxo-dGTP pyrophosphatase MutT (NUDIX family) n=1 Tax=Streptomyces zagrosensis TaxID=1042984 RepID=A0A7W9QER3_9ACTN|nr:NUDIX domain-containing protein [Streptomyces zagrosensis]MBB5938796.1 8-oxo-dGTP pyrophosphatase MutT (NUDIX family) [Streptomyces zagrosensis]
MTAAEFNPHRPLPLDVGASVLVTGPENSVLMVLVNYGDNKWHLPGGARARDEAPHQTATRRALRETGIRRDVRDVLAVDYRTAGAAPDKGEGLHIVYDGGTLTDDEVSGLKLPERVRGAHEAIGLIPPDQLSEHCSPRIAHRVTQALDARTRKLVLPMLTNGQPA